PPLRGRWVRLPGGGGRARGQSCRGPQPSLPGAHATSRRGEGSERRMSENTGIALPLLSDESIARIESAVFDEIGDDSASVPARSPERHPARRRWVTGLSIAAAFVVGALITPPLISAVSAGQGAADS